MPMKANGKTYYWTAEACKEAGVSKSTFLRWVQSGDFPDVESRDKRGWRLFTEDDLERLKTEVNQIHTCHEFKTQRLAAAPNEC
jgi:predicted site-specific integrase-resolvase